MNQYPLMVLIVRETVQAEADLAVFGCLENDKYNPYPLIKAKMPTHILEK